MDKKELQIKTEKNFVIVAFIIVFLTFLSLISNEVLVNKKNSAKLEKIIEFTENQLIFHKYLDQKRDLYWELNQVVYDSLNDKSRQDTIYKYRHSYIFGGIKIWGWDSVTLDDRYNFKFIIEDVFLNDLNFWTQTKEERYKRFHGTKKPVPPDTLLDDYYDIYKYLKSAIRNDQYIEHFFSKNLELKLSFFKEILSKYRISLPDTMKFTNSEKKEKDINRYIFSFINDSTNYNTAFTLYTYLGFVSSIPSKKLNNYYFNIQDIYRNAILKIYSEYIKDKFLVYDKNVFSEPLPYSTYINNIRKSQNFLESQVKNINPLKSSITTPLLQINFNIIILYKLNLWIVFFLSYLLRNIVIFYGQLFKNESNNRCEVPSILSMLLLTFKNKLFSIRALLFIIISGSILLLMLYIHVPFHSVIYEHFITSLIMFYLPLAFIIFNIFFKIKDVKSHEINFIWRK